MGLLELGHLSLMHDSSSRPCLLGHFAIDLTALQSKSLSTRPSFLSSLLSQGSGFYCGLRAHPIPPTPASTPFYSLKAFPSINFLPTSFYLGVFLLGGPELGQLFFSILILRTPNKIWYMFVLFYSSAILYNPPQFCPCSLQPLAHLHAMFINQSWNLAYKHTFKTISN